MTVRFAHERRPSPLFGVIRRPVARVSLQSPATGRWYAVTMLVDTGADFTLLPRWYADALGIDPERNCERVSMTGVGGKATVYLYRRALAKIGRWKRRIPIGFLETDNVVPLMGRQAFFETFRVIFEHYETWFELPGKRLSRAH